MKKPVFTLTLLLLLGIPFLGTAQFALVNIDSISITPVNPDPTDSIFIQFFGTQSDSCVYLADVSATANNAQVGINLDFTNNPAPPGLECIPTVLPWDTTFNIGPLAPGTYPIVMGGSNYSINFPPAGLVVIVPTPTCTDNSGDIWVTTTGDQGLGSLRNAINCANNTPGPNLIRFNIPGTFNHQISVGITTGQALPALTDGGTTIDGTTQPGYGPSSNFSPTILINGSFTSWTAPINALWIQGDDCKIFGLEIINFPDDAIDVMGASNVVIGAPGSGNIIYNNGWEQDFFPGAPGTGPWNGCGIVIREGATACSVSGNIIGTNENLDSGLGNEYCGILLRDGANNCIIGGAAFGQGNIITEHEIGVRVSNADEDLISGNQFYCNSLDGIQLVNNGNNNLEAPVLNNPSVTTISGTSSLSSGNVEVYINDVASCAGTPCQGRYLLGTATIVNGIWSLNAPFNNGIQLQGGERITAIASDGTRTSPFAACKITPGVSACTNADGSIEVTTTADEGAGSLREAINCANSTIGANTIRFSIPGNGPHIIFVGETSDEALPALTDAATSIDGTTQPGFGNNNNNPVIVLDGQIPTWTLPINGLFVRADFCEIFALKIRNFPDDAIDLTGANYCRIGEVDKGNVIINNGDEQDFFPDLPNTGPWNGCGVVMKSGASFNKIKGNFIGTNYSQTQRSGNEFCGVIIDSDSYFNEVGGTSAGEENVIVDNEQGIRINGSANGNAIRQNSIFCNTIIGINLLLDANNSIEKPSISVAEIDTISGSAGSEVTMVEVFINDDDGCANAPCQGKTYLGVASVSSGQWLLEAPFVNGLTLSGNETVTAVAIDDEGNSSEFATCINVNFPCNLQASIIDQMDATCGLANGFTTVGATNGQTPYLYDIGSGITSNPTFTDLATGDYRITVTDLNGCTTVVETTIGDSPAPSLTIGINNDATCLQSNGSFSALASGGTSPYTYDIGNGAQSDTLFTALAAGTYTVTATDALGCTATIMTTINDNGIPSLMIDQLEDPTCGQNNGEITVIASGGTPAYTYDIGNGPQNDPLFNNLSPGNYSVTVSDANACTATAGAVLNNQGQLPMAGFSYLADEATVTFTNTSTDGNSYSWDFDDGSTSTDENPVHIYALDGNYQVCLTVTNICGSDMICEIINIIVPLAEVTISGEVAKEDGTTVGLAEISCTGAPSQTTMSDGYFEFGGLTAGGDYTITPYKNTQASNGISVLDLVIIQRHLLLVDTLDSPYRYIAADVTNNGSISVTDLVVIQRIILLDLMDFPNNTSWRFVDANHVFDPNDPLDGPFPESIILPDLDMDAAGQDFVAVKIGDVSGNANPNQWHSGDPLFFHADDEYLKEGEIVTLELKAEQFAELVGFQTDLLFDTEALELVSVEKGSLTNLSWGNSRLEDGLLPLTWYDAEAKEEGMALVDGTPVLRVQFRALQSGKQLSELVTLSREAQRSVAYDIAEEAKPVDLVFDLFTNVEPIGERFLELGQNQPNPFGTETIIPFVLPEGGTVGLTVYDIAGKQITRKEAAFAAGAQHFEVGAAEMPGEGIYFYELNFGGERLLKRMVFMEE